MRLIAGTPYCRLSTRRDVVVCEDAELDETGAEPATIGALMVQRLLQLGRCDALFAQEQFAESDSHVLPVAHGRCVDDLRSFAG